MERSLPDSEADEIWSKRGGTAGRMHAYSVKRWRSEERVDTGRPGDLVVGSRNHALQLLFPLSVMKPSHKLKGQDRNATFEGNGLCLGCIVKGIVFWDQKIGKYPHLRIQGQRTSMCKSIRVGAQRMEGKQNTLVITEKENVPEVTKGRASIRWPDESNWEESVSLKLCVHGKNCSKCFTWISSWQRLWRMYYYLKTN